MGRLHRRDDVEAGEARNLGAVQDLRVLVAHAKRPCARHLALDTLERIHRDAIASIADGVNRGLESRFRRGKRLGIDLIRRRGQ